MAADNSDWTRDHEADTDPNPPRKKQRLSQEAETSPHSSDESVVIEALPVDDNESGNNINSAIELHDDLDMARFSDTLNLDPGTDIYVAPIDQIDFLLKSVTTGWLNTDYFDNLSQWLTAHVAEVSAGGPDVRERYGNDVEFFERLGQLCYEIGQRQVNLFTDGNAKAHGLQRLAKAVDRFVVATASLAACLLQSLPSILDVAVARRDSAQTAKKRQLVPSLVWIQVLAQILALYRAPQLTIYLRELVGYKHSTREFQNHFSHQTPIGSVLARLLSSLAHHHGDIENSWAGINAILHIIKVLDLQRSTDIESSLGTIRMVLLPVVCAKHPRALPDDFHFLLVDVAVKLLATLAQNADAQGLAEVYQQYVQGDQDALITEPQHDKDVQTLLRNVSLNNLEDSRRLMTAAWTLQAHRSYIFSEIVDVQSCGIAFLGNQLLSIYDKFIKPTGYSDHPEPKYAARFLRQNEMTKYIFGPKSHTSLVKQSQKIVGYLAITHEYTTLDTDIIWDSCMENVEIQFAKAAFAILMDISRFLDLDQLLHLVKKYTTTEPAKMGQDAVDSLTDLMQKLLSKQSQVRMNSGASTDDAHRLDAAFISIEIMMRADDTGRTALSHQLKEKAKNELCRFTDMSIYGVQDRKAIVERCVPYIVNRSHHATTSIEIVAIFIQQFGQAAEDILPVKSVVEEMAHYVTAQRVSVDNLQDVDIRGVEVRIDIIVRLIGLAGGNTSEEVLNSFFDCTVGALAISYEARERAWQMLPTMGAPGNNLLHSLLGTYLIDLPASLTTSRLVYHLLQQLESRAYSDASLQQNYSLLLQSAHWQKLVEFAESPLPIAAMAQDTICHMLFVVPKGYTDKTSVTACHTEFTKLQIRGICDEYTNIGNDPTQDKVSSIMGKVRLLDSVLTRSQEHSSSYLLAPDPDVNLSNGTENDTVCYSLQIHGAGRNQPTVVRAHADAATKTSELVARLPSLTGAASHRLIVAGQEIELAERADSPLSDLGVQESGVISICPKHDIHSDLGRVLTVTGAVEHQVLKHYCELEALLDAPDSIASKVCYHYLAQSSITVLIDHR